MEKNIKRYTVTTVLEYDKEGDVTREERCEDTEYYEPTLETKLTFTPFDGYVQYPYPNGTFVGIDPTLAQPATCGEPDVKTTATITLPLIDEIR